jgi:nucleoid DNA-binding protein
VDFGVFRVAHRRARAAFNPHSGTAMKLAARRFPRFAPGKRLRALVR